MSLISLLIVLTKLAPYIIQLAKIADSRIKSGASMDDINRAMERITIAFSKQNRAEGAKDLNDLWNDNSN